MGRKIDQHERHRGQRAPEKQDEAARLAQQAGGGRDAREEQSGESVDIDAGLAGRDPFLADEDSLNGIDFRDLRPRRKAGPGEGDSARDPRSRR